MIAADLIRVRAPSLPPGIDAYIVLDVLKTAAPQLYAQVCDLVSAHYSATMAAQYRRALIAPVSPAVLPPQSADAPRKPPGASLSSTLLLARQSRSSRS